MLKIRASSLAEIMTDPKGKDETLSVGAKTAITKQAKEFVYGYDERFSSKYTEKGLLVEDRSIELLNSVLFTDFKKNTERKTNEWLTGEADIVTDKAIIDIKSSWSLSTFPCLASEGENKTYEWQLRAYMMLWDLDIAHIAYCLVNTPDNLVGFEDKALHQIEHIAPELRVTLLNYTRDKALEDKIKFKVDEARKFYDLVVKQISDEHSK
jgi:hypothetical protein